jgi:RNA ligase (TIGR02306 family)
MTTGLQDTQSNTEAKRKLASIQTISSLSPIEGADRIEVAQVLGWQVVVKKGDFEVGENVIYLEVDSILPFKDWSEFLKDKNKPEKPIRLRTIRLRGQRSQGLVIPVTALLEHGLEPLELAGDMFPYEIGDDITDIIGVKKYEAPVPANCGGTIVRGFPSIVPKTDELRIQSFPDLIDEFQGRRVFVTTKVDGSSGTFIMNDGQFDVCSRNWSLKEDETNIFWQMARKHFILDKLRILGDCAIQGEVAGPGIQGNKLQLPNIQLFVFNIFDIRKGEYLGYKDFMDACTQVSLPTVPINCFQRTFNWTLDELLDMARGDYANTDGPREGIVIRPMDEFYSEVIGGRASFKVINNDFLEKYGN